MTYEDQLEQQADAVNRDVASRILRDINRKKRVIILIPGTATVTVDYPKISLAAADDLLRVGTQLSSTGLALCQAEGAMIMVLERFAQLIGARIYGLTDLPDLSMIPTDQLVMNSYEPVSYHEIPTVLDHVKTTSTKPESEETLTFVEHQHGAS